MQPGVGQYQQPHLPIEERIAWLETQAQNCNVNKVSKYEFEQLQQSVSLNSLSLVLVSLGLLFLIKEAK